MNDPVSVRGVRCAVGLPNVGEYGDPQLLVSLAEQAENAGWDGVFVWDHIAHAEREWPVADPYIVVAAIAAKTQRIRLGVMVTPLARRRPWKFARETASLDLLSGGRLIVGVGLGFRAKEEFAAFGEDPDPRRRAERLDEALDIVTGLWSGEPLTHHGVHYDVHEAVFRPRPLQRPRIPIWVAGTWPARRPFRRAARFDGVFPTFQGVGEAGSPTPHQLSDAVAYTLSHRTGSDAPFDVALEAQSDGLNAPLVNAYAAAGLTWWVEKLGWFRGPLDVTRRRIEQGPPIRCGP